MSRQRRRAPSKPRTESSKWVRCRLALRCGFGCTIQRGEWVRWGRNRTPVCAPCSATRYGLTAPAPVFNCRDWVVDFRARQAGDD